ncbi:MAG: hypothetical protein WCT49_02740 [Candidatus Paceibacterota bacterium]|jgi:predicted glycosyl hydrolase (DUF1957 family)|nr:hypothetical protein [Candidatus Paceibacterota bacterium]
MNPNIQIALMLHAYQPPTQTETMLNKIYVESYGPLISLLEREPNVFFSIDIAKSLGERLPANFLKRIATLYENKRLELVNTFAYHYLGPLTPKDFIKRQLTQNEEFYREHFIGRDALPGIFPPELAYSGEMADAFSELHYRWCLADDEPFVRMRHALPEIERAPFDWIPAPKGNPVILRSGMRSKEIAFKKYGDPARFADTIIDSHGDWGRRLEGNRTKGYIILALDAETFGHHHHGMIEDFLLPFANRIAERKDEAKIVSIDHIFQSFRKKAAFVPKGSWSTGEDPNPYPLWDHPRNPFHQAWKEFLDIAYSLVPSHLEGELKLLYDTSFYSCTPWQFSMGNNNIARWCLFNFTRIADLQPDGYEKDRLKELIAIMNRLTT